MKQKVAQILNRKVAERSDTSTESAVYEMLAQFFSFKASAATVGISTDKERLDQLDSPVLGSLKEPLVGSIVILHSATNIISLSDNPLDSGGLPPEGAV